MDIRILASGSTGNGYVVSDGVSSLLIECGISIKAIKQKLNFDLSGIVGCLISHQHLDHCKSARDVMKAGIDIYANKETLSSIEAVREYPHRWNQVNHGQAIEIETFVINPFELQHDVANTGYFIYSKVTKEKLVFITDSYYCKYRFAGLNFIMVECNYSPDILQKNIENGSVNEAMKNRLLESHFSLPNVKKFLKANDLSKVEEIYLIHLSNANSDEARFKKEIQELTGKVVYT